MTINYTTLLGLAQPVTGTETGQWGTVVNDEITALLEDAVANAASFSVSAGDVTLSTTNGSSNQARMSTLIITGTPGATRNVIVPSRAKIYVVINQSDGAVVIKGAATSGVTIGAGQTAQVAWNGSDFVEIGSYVHGNFVVNGNLSVNGDSTLGNAGADTTTINGLLVAANSNISKAVTLTTSVPAFAHIKGATYTDTTSSGTIAHAPFNLISAPVLSTSNVTTYTNASTFYIAGAPTATGSATITNPYAQYIAAGEAYFGGSVTGAAASTFSNAFTLSATTQNIALGTSQTSGTFTVGGAAQTGTQTFDQSTKAHTLNIGAGATESAATKTINIGTGGVATSTTAIAIGSTSGSTTTLNGTVNLNAGTANGVAFLDGSKVLTTGSALTFDGTNFSVDASGNPIIKLKTSGAGNNPLYRIQADTNYWDMIGIFSDANDTFRIRYNNTDYYQIDNTGISSWNVGGSELMRLTSTGLKSNIAGTNADPVFSYTSDTNTGIFFPAADTLGFTAGGGADQMVLTSTGLGIGTSSPGAKLHVASSAAGSYGAIIYNTSATGQGLTVRGGSTSSQDAFNVQTYDGNTSLLSVQGGGNVGIGASSPAVKLEVVAPAGDNIVSTFRSGDATAANNAGGGFRSISSATATSRIAQMWLDADGANLSGGDYFYIQKNGNSGTADIVQYSNAAMTFSTNATERARITSGGYFKASNDGTYLNSAGTYHEINQTANDNVLFIRSTDTAYSVDGVQLRFSRNTTNNSFYVFSYYNATAAAYKFRIADSGDVTNTNGTYGTISDAKMKTDIVDAGSQWSDIKALRFRKFKMKDDPSGLVQLGVVAQEVELTSPGLVDEHTDRDAEGNDLGTTTKSVKTSVLLMKAAVALQEAMARIEKLEAEVAALKGA